MEYRMQLGKIKYIEVVKTIWKSEPYDFTPWLANNINLLELLVEE
jgi:hypothetical protein